VTLNTGKLAGEVRSAGGGGFAAGNVTFVNIYDAGFVSFVWLYRSPYLYTFHHSHMVPFDQPEAALVSLTFS